ncbi:hypothetical protein Nepgr_020414 [Nepenthes gracilis]|uniref:Uncharacterized protein n=1 Tax=Nepenthes gracilis TaxID=150966 RepID=A0AAD3SV13_NEPGR|nr:hypothetical protein Nepgr_020414 [Nepenthes gracilis]
MLHADVGGLALGAGGSLSSGFVMLCSNYRRNADQMYMLQIGGLDPLAGSLFLVLMTSSCFCGLIDLDHPVIVEFLFELAGSQDVDGPIQLVCLCGFSFSMTLNHQKRHKRRHQIIHRAASSSFRHQQLPAPNNDGATGPNFSIGPTCNIPNKDHYWSPNKHSFGLKTRTSASNRRKESQPAVNILANEGSWVVARLREQRANNPTPSSHRTSQILQLAGSNEQLKRTNRQRPGLVRQHRGGSNKPAKIGNVPHRIAHHHTSCRTKVLIKRHGPTKRCPEPKPPKPRPQNNRFLTALTCGNNNYFVLRGAAAAISRRMHHAIDLNRDAREFLCPVWIGDFACYFTNDAASFCLILLSRGAEAPWRTVNCEPMLRFDVVIPYWCLWEVAPEVDFCILLATAAPVDGIRSGFGWGSGALALWFLLAPSDDGFLHCLAQFLALWR